MREIFKYCSCADLFRLCIADDKLKAAVLECGIPGKLIDFREFGDFSIPSEEDDEDEYELFTPK